MLKRIWTAFPKYANKADTAPSIMAINPPNNILAIVETTPIKLIKAA